jgi:hypothetical protein
MEAFDCMKAYLGQIVSSARARTCPANFIDALVSLESMLRTGNDDDDDDDDDDDEPQSAETAGGLVEAALKHCRDLLNQFEQKSWFGKLVKRRTQKNVRRCLRVSRTQC